MVFTSLTQAPIYYAFNHMDIGSASLLFFVSMFLSMYIIGFIFLGEQLKRVCSNMERWPSGLRRTLGKRVGRKLTQVQILSSPPILNFCVFD